MLMRFSFTLRAAKLPVSIMGTLLLEATRAA
jgi:hypothetical protein